MVLLFWGDLNSSVSPAAWGSGNDVEVQLAFFLNSSLLIQQRITGRKDLEEIRIY